MKGSLSREDIWSTHGSWRDCTCLFRIGQYLMNSFGVIRSSRIPRRHAENRYFRLSEVEAIIRSCSEGSGTRSRSERDWHPEELRSPLMGWEDAPRLMRRKRTGIFWIASTRPRLSRRGGAHPPGPRAPSRWINNTFPKLTIQELAQYRAITAPRGDAHRFAGGSIRHSFPAKLRLK